MKFIFADFVAQCSLLIVFKIITRLFWERMAVLKL